MNCIIINWKYHNLLYIYTVLTFSAENIVKFSLVSKDNIHHVPIEDIVYCIYGGLCLFYFSQNSKQEPTSTTSNKHIILKRVFMGRYNIRIQEFSKAFYIVHKHIHNVMYIYKRVLSTTDCKV